MPPASRVGDFHVCPQVTVLVPHVGGPALPSGCPTVLIGGMPAARVGDVCVCAGPPDVILKGSPTVLIGGMMAARIGDLTAHGGMLVMGFPTVLIGEAGMGAPGAAGMELVKDTGSRRAPAAKAGITPKEADQIIANKYKSKFTTEAQKKGGLGEKGTKVLNDAEFKKIYKQTFGEDGEYEMTAAFADPNTGEIFLHKDRMNGGTPYHETLHLYISDNFDALGVTNIEGATEYLTRKETDPRKISRSRHYDDEQAAYAALAKTAGDDKLEDAYFGGKVDDLKKAVDEKAGAGAADKFFAAMSKKDFDAAKKALAPKKK